MNHEAETKPKRWTRDYVFDVLRKLEIKAIFGVPGTNEIPIIDGTSGPANGVRYIQCLHENIALGAAMGHARMSGKPGVVVVHVTPGIAHSIGNLFNAWRSRIPLVIICCQQQNELVTQEPLLASNLVELARQYTKWAHEVRAPEEIPLVLQRAFKEAMAPPNGPVFLSVPWEFTIREIAADDSITGITNVSPHFIGDASALAETAKVLRAAKNPVIVAGDGVGSAGAWPEIQALAELIGAPVLSQSFSSVANFPNDDYHWQGELPGSQSGMQGVFNEHDVAFSCGLGAQAQVAVFKYADGPLIPTQVRQIHLANNTWDLGKNQYCEPAILGDIKATLPFLNDLLLNASVPGAKGRNDKLRELDKARRDAWEKYLALAQGKSEIWAVVIADELRRVIHDLKLEKKFIYVHEAVSDPAPFQYLLPLGTVAAEPISYYCVAGGSLGWSMPASLGIKVEGKGHQGITADLVINAVGDGSSLFYPQTWWTAAHRELGILYIITNNREYHTLQVGLQQVVGAYGSTPGYRWTPRTLDPEYLRIQNPVVDLIGLARAFGGIEGEVVKDRAEVGRTIRRGIDYVLKNRRSYVLDIWTAQDTLVPPATAAAASVAATGPLVAEPLAEQPPLDFFHRAPATGSSGFGPTGAPAPRTAIPAIF
jgi:benzoylformate decarboxylase